MFPIWLYYSKAQNLEQKSLETLHKLIETEQNMMEQWAKQEIKTRRKILNPGNQWNNLRYVKSHSKRMTEETQLTKIRHEEGRMTTDTKETQRIIRQY